MQFMIKALDGPNMLEKRMEVRPRHLEGMKALGKHIIAAGGLLSSCFCRVRLTDGNILKLAFAEQNSLVPAI